MTTLTDAVRAHVPVDKRKGRLRVLLDTLDPALGDEILKLITDCTHDANGKRRFVNQPARIAAGLVSQDIVPADGSPITADEIHSLRTTLVYHTARKGAA